MSVTVKCIVVDDEPLAAKLISTYVERTPFLELAGVAHDAEVPRHTHAASFGYAACTVAAGGA